MSAAGRDIAFLLGLPFNVMTMDQAVDDAVAHIQSRRPGYYITANADFVAQACHNDALRDIIFHADRILCDGMPLVWLSRYFKPSLPERVAGSDLVFRLFKEADARNWSVFFLGSDSHTLGNARAILSQEYPRMNLCGTFSPPIGSVESWPNEAMVEAIQAAQPDLLLVAVGCPKQELWISKYYQDLGVPLSIGIGASLDFVCGTQRRAPRWIQQVGMEWMWRLLNNPKRMLKRYAFDFYYLLLLVYRQWQCLRQRGSERVAADTVSLVDEPQERGGGVLESSVCWLVWEGAVEYAHLGALPVPEGYSAPVFIDLSRVDFIDSSGIGLLAKVARQARQAKVVFGLLRPSGVVGSILKAMQLEAQLPTYADRAAALAALVGSPGNSVQRLKLSPSSITQNHCAWSESLQTAVAALAAGGRLVVDLSEIDRVDSFAISCFVALHEQALQRGATFRVEHLSAQAVQAMKMADVYDTLVYNVAQHD
ncbi:MAG: N-acetylglucosaminyldiphosphoundecaprenol N-acetyl-beta-D-mannosaminyltransferase [Lentimonas sp.]|jgi:N-acetylglucosaminyldiphosphoundecaprenol N-acetyl-beta-D-mannosaminyltransferase